MLRFVSSGSRGVLRLREAGFASQRRCVSSTISTLGLQTSASVNSIDNISVKRIASLHDIRYQQGDVIHGYKVDKVYDVNDLNAKCVELTHCGTGAKHLHVARIDADNVFSVAFKTPPEHSGGTTHVLEHVALCGSQSFPCRDPFFHMLNRSMATFMNAMTANNYTFYPFSTQNTTDYYNLMSVYLDASFFPKLRKMDFLQEGWRLENEDPQDKNSPLMFKGVVWNEMKGALSNSDAYFYYEKLKHLYTGTDSYVSGGDPPSIIADLTYESLVNYHANHYHPSNSIFYTYGDIALEGTLAAIESNVLEKFAKSSNKITLSDPSNFNWAATDAQVFNATGPLDPLLPADKQSKCSVDWPMSITDDVHEHFIRKVVSILLVNGNSSPMYQALIASKIATDFTPGTGYDNSHNVPMFSVGGQGLYTKDMEMVQQVVYETMEKVLQDGFAQNDIYGLKHQLMVDRLTQKSQFGLKMLYGIVGTWAKGLDIEHNINIDIQGVLQTMLEGDRSVINSVIGEQLLGKDGPDSNQSKKNALKASVFTMVPNASFHEALQTNEAKQLEEMTSKLSSKDKDEIFEIGQNLLKDQQKESDVSCLPCLKLADIERKIDSVAIETSTQGFHNGAKPVHADVQKCFQPTNTISYLRVLYDLDEGNIPQHLLPYLPLFSQLLTQCGTQTMDHKSLQQYLRMNTGGVSVSNLLVQDGVDSDKFKTSLLITGSTFPNDMEHLANVLSGESGIFNPDFSDTDNLTTLLDMMYSDLGSGVIQSGHQMAMTRAQACHGPFFQQQEQWSGVSQIQFLRKLMSNEDYTKALTANLNQLARHIFTNAYKSKNIKIAVNTDDARFLQQFPYQNLIVDQSSTVTTPASAPENTPTTCEHKSNQHVYIPVASNTHFVGMSVPAVALDHQHHPALRVASSLMTSKFLHKEIREKGGAYGGGSTLGNGVLNFYSYRDPNIENTIDAFKNGLDWLLQDSSFSDAHIDEAKLSILQKTDMPVPPSNKGLSGFIYGDSDARRQYRRDALFAVDRTQILDAVKQIIVPNMTQANIAVIGPNEKSSRDNITRDWKTEEL